MNVELVNPHAVLGLFGRDGSTEQPHVTPGPQRAGSTGWTRRLRERLAEELRYRRALGELNRLDRRELVDLDLNGADFPALARHHATGGRPRGRWER